MQGNSIISSTIYRDYDELKYVVVKTIMMLIKKTKGSVITFTAKKIAMHAGIPTHPVVLTLIKDVLDNLTHEGYVKKMAKTSHGTKYMVGISSPLWRASKDESFIHMLSSPYLKTVVMKINKK